MKNHWLQQRTLRIERVETKKKAARKQHRWDKWKRLDAKYQKSWREDNRKARPVYGEPTDEQVAKWASEWNDVSGIGLEQTLRVMATVLLSHMGTSRPLPDIDRACAVEDCVRAGLDKAHRFDPAVCSYFNFFTSVMLSRLKLIWGRKQNAA